jgi:hypothetical protein
MSQTFGSRIQLENHSIVTQRQSSAAALAIRSISALSIVWIHLTRPTARALDRMVFLFGVVSNTYSAKLVTIYGDFLIEQQESRRYLRQPSLMSKAAAYFFF